MQEFHTVAKFQIQGTISAPTLHLSEILFRRLIPSVKCFLDPELSLEIILNNNSSTGNTLSYIDFLYFTIKTYIRISRGLHETSN